MTLVFYIQVLWVLSLCYASPVLDLFDLGNFRAEYDRNVQCSDNNTAVVNDYTKTLFLNCNGNEANTSNLLKCTGLTRVSGFVFMDCQLPTPYVASLVKELQPQALAYLIVKFPVAQEKIIVKDLPFIELLGLSIRNSTKYIFQNLPGLRQLDMVFPDIDIFPERLLSNLSLLNHIYLANGRIGILPETTFRGLKRLRVLNLRNNTIKILPGSLFDGLRQLQNLELSYNHLESLPAGIFNHLISLEGIILAGNLLVELHPTLFVNQKILRILDISYNKELSMLPEELLKSSRNLKNFFARNCNIKFVSEKLFSNAVGLSMLTLANNRISTLSEKLFEGNVLLSSLDLSGNRIQFLPKDIFRKNYKLETLILDNNLFETIPAEALLSTKSITQISLQNNILTRADEQQLEYLENLQILALNNNNISSFSTPIPFGKIRHLVYLDLSFNHFVSFPKLDWSAYNISILLMNNNEISHLEISSLPTQNATVDLSFNQIESVSIPTTNSTLQLGITSLNLSSNPFLCDCKLRDFLQILYDGSSVSISVTDIDKMVCDDPPSWKNQQLMQISPLYLLCPVSDLCPQLCHCYYLNNLVVLVNCSSLGLTAFPDVLPKNTTVVHLENNSISEFTAINIDYWETVTYLYLDHNRLSTPNFWPALNVKYLSLRNNFLVRLPKDLMEYVTKTSEFLLDVRENSWMCDCTNLPFKLWLKEYEENLVFPEEILCNRTLLENGTLVSYSILKVPDDAFCPFTAASATVRVIVVFASCSLCFVVVILVILHFGNKETFLAYIYVHFPCVFCYKFQDVEGEKTYDAFISYTSSDREAIITILKELEEKPPNFKFCLHERDWLPGYPIISQIETSVQNSKKTIIFLSQEFLNSFWCETEFQAAYLQSLEDKIDRLIIVVKGELPENDSMPLDMQNLLATKTYLVWGERWFWEKLRYALPHLIRIERKVERELIVEGMIQELRENKMV